VPVVQVRRVNSVPGGAANVARNVLSLGAHVELFGVRGEDGEGEELASHLRTAGAGLDGMLSLSERPTTVKTRVLAGNQQVVRVDREVTSPLSVAHRRELRKRVVAAMESGKIQALILEDYAKGVFGKDFMQGLVNDAAQYGVPCMLDPHPSNVFNVKGLTLMTPNRNEAFALAGKRHVQGSGQAQSDKPLLAVAEKMGRLWNPEYLMITLGAQGMAMFYRDGREPQHIPTQARQVFDVSGAGDTVMATMVLSLLAGACPMDAARIANEAAGVVVGMVGTAAIEAETLKNRLASDN